MVPFDVLREYRQRRMSGAGQDLFHMTVASLWLRQDEDRANGYYCSISFRDNILFKAEYVGS